MTFRKVSVRGLCADSLFNSIYLYNIDDQGRVLYLGIFSSFLTFDEVSEIFISITREESQVVCPKKILTYLNFLSLTKFKKNENCC